MFDQLRMGLSQACLNLGRAKTRTILSTIGFVIGSACIVTIWNVGASSAKQAEENFRAMQPDVWVLRTGLARPESNEKLDLAALHQLADMVPAVDTAALASFQMVVVPLQGEQKTINVATYTSALSTLLHLKIQFGRSFSPFDLGQRTTIIGSDFSTAIGSEVQLGSSVRLGGTVYLVVGILAPQPTPAGLPYTIDETAFIPRGPETGMSLAGLQGLDTALVRVKSSKEPATTKEAILTHFRLHSSEPPPTVLVPERLYAIMNSQGVMLSNLLLSTAAIAMFLGAASMLNLMLTAVRERRKEIGIRLAIGARPHDILALFLCEAFLLSAVGGVLGSLLGTLGSAFVQHFLDMPSVITLEAFLIGSSIAVLTGIVAGGYPAWSGSRMEPLEGLLSH